MGGCWIAIMYEPGTSSLAGTMLCLKDGRIECELWKNPERSVRFTVKDTAKNVLKAVAEEYGNNWQLAMVKDHMSDLFLNRPPKPYGIMMIDGHEHVQVHLVDPRPDFDGYSYCGTAEEVMDHVRKTFGDHWQLKWVTKRITRHQISPGVGCTLSE